MLLCILFTTHLYRFLLVSHLLKVWCLHHKGDPMFWDPYWNIRTHIYTYRYCTWIHTYIYTHTLSYSSKWYRTPPYTTALLVRTGAITYFHLALGLWPVQTVLQEIPCWRLPIRITEFKVVIQVTGLYWQQLSEAQIRPVAITGLGQFAFEKISCVRLVFILMVVSGIRYCKSGLRLFLKTSWHDVTQHTKTTHIILKWELTKNFSNQLCFK